MRIIKYIFLLLLLAFFALFIFVATQKGDFEVERSKVIQSPRVTVFNYINDYRNWENFGSWKTDDPKMIFIYPQQTIGKGGSYSWKGQEGDGIIKTVAVTDHQSIRQKMDYDGTVSEVFWTFKDTVGGTKVTWRSKGNMGFGFKIYSTFNGGADKIIGTIYERSLVNLDKSLDYEINTFHIKIDGVVKKLGTYYIEQRIVSKISNVSKNLRIMLPKLIYFFKKNKITIHGKPFVIYHAFDMAKRTTDMSVCIPVAQQVSISPGSDVNAGKLDSFQALKATLTGDYSHLQEAWNKTFEHMKKTNIIQDETSPYVEMYSVNMVQEKHPSKWVTNVYIPVKSKPAPAAVRPKTAVSVKAVIPAAEVPAP